MMKSFWRKIQQRFDRDFYNGNGLQFVWLLSIIAVFFLTFVGFCKAADITVWRMVELLLDPGSFGGSEGHGNVYFQLFVTLVGAVIFTSFTINAIGNFLDRRLESVDKGRVSYDFDSHIVFLGANGMLMNILNTSTDEEKDIVIVTEDVERVRDHVLSQLPESKSKRVYVVYGSRVLKTTLENVKASKASSIYILGEDNEPMHDALSLECWSYLRDLCRNTTQEVKCYLVLDRLSTEHSFHYKSDSASDGNLHLIVINAVENAAQRVLVSQEYGNEIKYPALDRDGIGADSEIGVHLVVVGMTQMAYAMAITAAHNCHFPNFRTKGVRTKISFVMKDIQQEMDFFKGHYSQLMELSYHRYIRWENGIRMVSASYPSKTLVGNDVEDKKGFLDVEWEFIDGAIESDNVREYLKECAEADGKSEYLTIAVCEHDPETNVAISLYLPAEIYEKKIPVLVYQKTSGEVLRSAATTDRFGHIYPFGMKCDCYDPQFQERLRRAKRIAYLYDHSDSYLRMPDEAELDKAWFKLKYIYQRSNLYAANSIPAKLRSIGIAGMPHPLQTLDAAQVDILSEAEHNRWNIERLLAGFKAYPYEKRMELKGRFEDPAQKPAAKEEHNKAKDEKFLHKDIAPYGELLSDSKNYDKVIVRNILDVMR